MKCYYIALDKHGVASDGCLELVQYIMEDCHHLSIAGLMTIGRMNHQHEIHGPNPDFTVHTAALAEPFKREFPSVSSCL